MSETKVIQSLINLGNALRRLEEAVGRKTDDRLLIDGTFQRFEFTFELFWKTLKRLLEVEGIESKTPRETLKHAFKVEWLTDEPLWLHMLKDRNLTSHIYDESEADKIYKNIKEYVPEMRETYDRLQEWFRDYSD